MSFDIGFFFTYKNKVVQLPVNPEKFTVSFSGNNETKEIISLGEINLLKRRKLAEMSFESFLPYDTWFPATRTTGQFERPKFYKWFFEGIMNDRKPVLFTVTGVGTNEYVSIEDFEWYHQAGNHEDVYFSLTLKEYIHHEIIPIALPASTESGETVEPTQSPGTIQVTDSKKAETVQAIAPAEITIGCEVILNGTVHYDSYGSKPGKTFSNYRGKVNFINKKGSHPYHVTTPTGGWLGWVLPDAVKLA